MAEVLVAWWLLVYRAATVTMGFARAWWRRENQLVCARNQANENQQTKNIYRAAMVTKGVSRAW